MATKSDNAMASKSNASEQIPQPIASKQGMHSGATKQEERGRDEFRGDGSSADVGGDIRAEQAGRHYGRSGDEVPGPGLPKGELQEENANSAAPAERDRDLEGAQPARSQGRHGPVNADQTVKAPRQK